MKMVCLKKIFIADFPLEVAERRCFPESVTVLLFGAKARENKRRTRHHAHPQKRTFQAPIVYNVKPDRETKILLFWQEQK